MAILAAAAPYLMAGSAALGAISSIQAGQQASQSAKYNAAVQDNNAQLATQNATMAGREGAANAAIEQQKTRAAVGGIKAAQAANNIDVNSGSAVDVRSSAAELGELNAISIRSNAARTAYGYQTQSASDTAQSQLDKQQAKYDATAGYVKGATTLIGGAATAANNWGGYTNSTALNSDAADNNFLSHAWTSAGQVGP